MKSKILTASIFAGLCLFPFTVNAVQDDTVEDSKDAARRAAGTEPGNVEIEKLDDEETPDETTEPDSAETFVLNGIKINSEIDVQQKHVQDLIDPYIGQRVGIKELKELTMKIRDFCRNEGWLAAVAYLPEQDSSDGIITINISTAKFGKTFFNNESKLDDDILEALAKRLTPDKAVTSKRIEDVLYRINEIGGLKARGALVPDTHTRTIELHANVTDDVRRRGIFYVENYGSKSSGRYRAGLIYDLFNLDNRGSRLEVSGLLSNKDLDNYAFDYSIISNRRTTSRLGISIGKTSYHLAGPAYTGLDVGGDSTDYRIYGITPIFKAVHEGLEWNYGYKFRNVTTSIKIDGIPLDLDDKRYVHTFSVGLKGYKRSLHNDLFNYSFTVYNGYVSNRSPYSRFIDSLNGVSGSFYKSQLTADYRKLFGKYWEFHTNLLVQNASKTLYSSERLILGGANGVRGYADGDGSGDMGYLSKSEFIWHTKFEGLSFSLFFDIGGVGDKRDHELETMRSWGIGLNYSKPNDYFFRVDYARKIGNNINVASDNRRDRIWFMAGKIF